MVGQNVVCVHPGVSLSPKKEGGTTRAAADGPCKQDVVERKKSDTKGHTRCVVPTMLIPGTENPETAGWRVPRSGRTEWEGGCAQRAQGSVWDELDGDATQLHRLKW